MVQMFLMLPPAPKNRAAEASATNAMSRVYSMRSCPCSSFQRLRKNVIVFAPKFCFVLCDRLITCLCFRDLAITACSAALVGHGCRFARGLLIRPENQSYAVVVHHPPAARFL